MATSIPKYLINLPERTERLYNSIEQLRKVDLDDMITIVKAVTPEQAQQQQFHYLSKTGYQNIQNPKNSILIPNYQALACSISHRNCWKHMILHEIEEAFIIEDDIEISNSNFFRFELEQMMDVIEEHSHKAIYILFNGTYVENNNNDSNYFSLSHTESLHQTLIQYGGYTDIKYFPYIDYSVKGSHFYYLNLKMASFLLNKLRHIQYQLDIEISNLAKVYSCHLFLNIESSSIYQSEQFPSDIQFHLISRDDISKLFNFNLDLSENIWSYLPTCFRA